MRSYSRTNFVSCGTAWKGLPMDAFRGCEPMHTGVCTLTRNSHTRVHTLTRTHSHTQILKHAYTDHVHICSHTHAHTFSHTYISWRKCKRYLMISLYKMLSDCCF